MQVQEDILKQLRLSNPVKLVSSFNRPNIHYSVRILTQAQSEPLPQIVALLKEGRKAHPEGQWPCGIIYTLKKESTEEVAMALSSKGMHNIGLLSHLLQQSVSLFSWHDFHARGQKGTT